MTCRFSTGTMLNQESGPDAEEEEDEMGLLDVDDVNAADDGEESEEWE